MNQWDIFSWSFPEAGTHPAVIVSHPDRVGRKPYVNVLYCASQRASRPAEGFEVMLDETDGLDWETLCRCDLLYFAPRSSLKERRGNVTPERRRQIILRINASMGWWL